MAHKSRDYETRLQRLFQANLDDPRFTRHDLQKQIEEFLASSNRKMEILGRSKATGKQRDLAARIIYKIRGPEKEAVEVIGGGGTGPRIKIRETQIPPSKARRDTISAQYRSYTRETRTINGRPAIRNTNTLRWRTRNVEIFRADKKRAGWSRAVVLRDPQTGRFRRWIKVK